MLGDIDKGKLPVHIAIIMDGNGRWAQKKGLPRVMGHKAGMEALKKTVKSCSDLGIKILTVYAFSTENWNRPQDEVNYLMDLLVEYMRREVNALHKNKVKIKILGEVDMLPDQTRTEIEEAIELTKNNEGLQFNIALNYGGRAEILRACRNLIKDLEAGNLDMDSADEKVFSNYLYTSNDPDPDLIIRTSGEQRISNFLLWQGAYSELLFVDQLWPDFDEAVLHSAILEYKNRSRRFGALK
ncbi:MAG TPA: isoprenyl transferase [Bacillota bacterium]|nr:isoprenyl transferase [Clostridiaceae bacterium]HNR03994.1 isoprenyl transferase [Bacillota bacterium]HNT02265.1 isoprenyl transferase [Bacillota bacterium]HPA54383.1 isoprenyl transferase [Bacillota bacterium]HPX68742.1 isoprenyl transferase [Bacillota bacterium]